MPDDPKEDPKLDPKELERRRKFDEAYRKAYSHRRVIADFVLHFLPATARRYDLSRPEHMSGTFITGALGKRRADMVWRLDSGLGSWPHVYLLFEFQASPQRDMAMRTTDYSVRIWMSLEPQDRGPNGEYPTVMAIVPNTGERRWTAATNVRELFGENVSEEELRHRPSHQFLAYDFRWLDLGDPAPDNVAARLIRLEQAKSGAELDELAGQLVVLLREEGEGELVDDVEPLINQILAARFVGEDGRLPTFRYLTEGDDDMNLLERARAWGAERDQEWLEKGVAQGKRELACRMAAGRFGAEAAERLDRALGERPDPDRVEAAAALVFQCGTVDELLAELARRA